LTILGNYCDINIIVAWRVRLHVGLSHYIGLCMSVTLVVSCIRLRNLDEIRCHLAGTLTWPLNITALYRGLRPAGKRKILETYSPHLPCFSESGEDWRLYAANRGMRSRMHERKLYVRISKKHRAELEVSKPRECAQTTASIIDSTSFRSFTSRQLDLVCNCCYVRLRPVQPEGDRWRSHETTAVIDWSLL